MISIFRTTSLDWKEERLASLELYLNWVHIIPRNIILQLYDALVHSLILYSIKIWGTIFPSYLKRLKTLQNRAIKLVARCHYRDVPTCFIVNLKHYKLMICGNMKLLNSFTALLTTKIQIRFAIIFLNPQNVQNELHDNLPTIRIKTLLVLPHN